MAELLSFFVNIQESSQRLDQIVSGHYEALSRTRVQVLIRKGHIKVDGQEASPGSRVKEGMCIQILVPDPEDPTPQPQALPLDILYEDADILVINKAAGMVVHPAPGSLDQTLVNALLAHCGVSLSGIGGVKRPGIVHRLDKGTSGLLVVAKNDLAHRGLSQQFSSRLLSRTYQALVWGVPSPLMGSITGNIGRCSRHRQKMKLLSSGGKEAVTHYTTLRIFGVMASLVECRLETGRTHQIRVHLTSRGHPVMGDPTYGRPFHKAPLALKQAITQLTEGQRPLLHAWRLSFKHPRTQAPLCFEVDLPEDFTSALKMVEELC